MRIVYSNTIHLPNRLEAKLVVMCGLRVFAVAFVVVQVFVGCPVMVSGTAPRKPCARLRISAILGGMGSLEG